MKTIIPEIEFLSLPQQDTSKPELSPYLQSYFRYLRTVEKDSFFHKQYKLSTYKLILGKAENSIPNQLYFVKDVSDSLFVKNENTIINKKDSIKLVSSDTLTTEQTGKPSLFFRNSGQQNSSQIVKFDWYIGVLLVSVVFFAWIRFFFRRELDKIFEAFFNNQTSHKVFLEQNTNTQRASFLLNGLFVVSLSFFLFFVVQYAGINTFIKDKMLLFLVICGTIILIYLLKYVVYKILGFIFLSERSSNEYLHNVFLYSKAVGICLLPITIGLSYLPSETHIYLLYTGGILFGISFIARVYRGLQISSRSRLSVFYLFLYLCTLEIAPFVVLFKFLGIMGFQ